MSNYNVLELLSKHRSIRRFSDRGLEPGVLDSLLSAGQAAATSSFIQACSVVRVKDIENRNTLVELTGGQGYVASAAEFLVLCADLHRNQHCINALDPASEADFGWTEQFIASTVDVALFAQNMVIAAESLDLGCCYIGGIRNNPQEVCELLELPELVYPVFGLCIGYPDQDPLPKPRLPLTTVLHDDKYREPGAEDIRAYDQVVKDYYVERTRGKLDFSWSQQMAKQAATQKRPFMKEFINNRGLAKK